MSILSQENENTIHFVLEYFFYECCERLNTLEKEDPEFAELSSGFQKLYEQITDLLPEDKRFLMEELEEQNNALHSTELDYIILLTIRLTVELLRALRLLV